MNNKFSQTRSRLEVREMKYLLKMKKILIFLLFLTLSSGQSIAETEEKITIDEVEKVLLGKNYKNKYPIINVSKKRTKEDSKKSTEAQKNWKKGNKARNHLRGIAKCMFGENAPYEEKEYKRCRAKVINAVFTYPEKSKIRRPGDIFYALIAINYLSNNYETRRVYTKAFTFYEGDKPKPGMVCRDKKYDKYKKKNRMFCKAYSKGTFKKIEKFRNDPSNEKVLGHKLIKLVKSVRMQNNMKKKIGTNNYLLIGDMLNSVVIDVKKNEISPYLKNYIVLLKKYSLLLDKIKINLEKNKYKLIEKDVSILSKTFYKLKETSSNNEFRMIDDAIIVLTEIDLFIQEKSLMSEGNTDNKDLSLAAIYIMQDLIDSLLEKFPKKYYAETQPLPIDLYSDKDLNDLGVIINNMIKINQQNKLENLAENKDKIKSYINVDEIFNNFKNLGIETSENKVFTEQSAFKVADNLVRENLDNELFANVKKMLQKMDDGALKQITKEAAAVAKEVAKAPEVKSHWDRKIGNISLKKLIGAHCAGHINLGIGGC